MSGIGHIGEIRIIEFLRKRKTWQFICRLGRRYRFRCGQGNNFYQIQVKTSMFQKDSYFWFDIYKHKMIYSKNTFYIFVCATMSRRQFYG